jgi:hypothetical protein
MLTSWLWFILFFIFTGADFSFRNRFGGLEFLTLMGLTQLCFALADFIILQTLWDHTYEDTAWVTAKLKVSRYVCCKHGFSFYFLNDSTTIYFITASIHRSFVLPWIDPDDCV